ncbi:hypothetical protein GCM10009828_054550 [Actinoplanes couchii]|uniref:Uncharacterized protein n=1 Tax=Actinoplanes couchii TaxID=403638 RepID=A0ABQ3XRM5_9ACTN|nr:hypothetical protein Aco03nite_095680 [Actinoplanes couchii]
MTAQDRDRRDGPDPVPCWSSNSDNCAMVIPRDRPADIDSDDRAAPAGTQERQGTKHSQDLRDGRRRILVVRPGSRRGASTPALYPSGRRMNWRPGDIPAKGMIVRDGMECAAAAGHR